MVHNLSRPSGFGNNPKSYFDHKVSESLLSSNSTQEKNSVYSYYISLQNFFFSCIIPPSGNPLYTKQSSGVFTFKRFSFLLYITGWKINERKVVCERWKNVKKEKKKWNFPARENAQNSIRARRETKNEQFNVHNRASAYFFECREIPCKKMVSLPSRSCAQ